MTLDDLLFAIDKVSRGEFGYFSSPSRSEYVVDPRTKTLWDLKPVFGLMLEGIGWNVSGGIKPMTTNALKTQIRAQLPEEVAVISFPTKEARPLGIRSHSTDLPPVQWQTASVGISVEGDGAPVFLENEGVAYYFTQTKVYLRDALVIGAARSRARGCCECCGQPAPFHTAAGWPYLEVHHVVPLSRGGPDTLANVLALCPNCHRHAHFGPEKAP